MAHASDMHSLEFRLPDLGEGLTEAEIVRWLVEVGDLVAVDQPVVEVETAKAMVEVPCPYGGVVTARFGEEGTELPVGAPLITVAVGAPAADGPAGGSGNVLVGYGTSEAPARRRRVRPEPTAPAAPSAPASSWAANGNAGPSETRVSATGGPVADATATGVPGAAVHTTSPGPVPVISPLVRRLARENGLDLRELTGSGPDGLILRADVEHALRAAAGRGRSAEPSTTPSPPPHPTRPWPSRRPHPTRPGSPHRPQPPSAAPVPVSVAAATRAPAPATPLVSPSRVSVVPSPTSSPAAAVRSRTRPAGSTPTPRNSCGHAPR